MSYMQFPEGFKWGSTTSAHQIEGDNYNDWSEWEKSRPPEFRSGKACDSYNRYEEDFDIAKSLNQNIHRFSIEWSRIEPKEGIFDHEAMHHYVNVVKALKERGIEPMITLWHFTNPVWFAEKGGFLNIDSPTIFTRYVKYVVDNLKDRVGLWITFNEPWIYAGGSYLKGQWPPQKHNIFKAIKVRNNIVRSHTLAYQEIKRVYDVSPKNQGLYDSTSHNIEPLVGGVENNLHIMSHPVFKGIVKFLDQFVNLYFWNKTLPYQDFIGLNYYTTVRLPGTRELRRVDFVSEMNWDVYPKGIYHRLMELKKYKKPIFITENGVADSKDERRGKFIKEHLKWVWQAIHDGVDIRGYLYWSLLDNFEWAYGFRPRFGLVEIDYATFARKIRPSAFEYAKICRANAMDISQSRS
ncbi:MAG: hypothetical protein A2915_03470 [Candidatus Yanofskybacteria bacterium RIFCSPLOWO2_01_FULL_41_34]|uniref:Beta-glucosidase n=1 Tax=Candidatus Yanofskybacteria bacterium RIFCSPHIGHO2_01_FULL_41_26 TaxID=1802661 RepID=A0A1F8EDP2_9BACT|nr:MAG: hypothetical protein A2649_01365 [Candidatus Yanofskybacteria bacterium RIFCSPHIGHO2_01_FULL_41_26]OGN21089.1 MAG: hypothetical protein A2915_03470 [Candidatus Yanofskybacteria bacterium RIFCSPLOWO2_01_FULL_41_34]